MKKLLWLSDSPMTTTGYGIIGRNVCNFLKEDYEVHFLAHNYYGQVIKPPIYMEDDTKIDFFIHGTGQKRYAMDMISPTIRKYDIDIFGGYLDSLPEHRPIILKDKKGNVDIYTFDELWNKIKKGEKDWYILSPELKISKERKWKTKHPTKNIIYNNSFTKKEIIGKWTKIQNVARRFVKNHDIIKINDKYGETEVTTKHSLLYVDNNKIKKITPKLLEEKNKNLLQINRLNFQRKSTILNKCKGKYWEAYTTFYGAYVSEGCLSHYNYNYSIIISNSDKEWNDKIIKSIKILFNKTPSIQKTKDGVYNIVFYGKNIYNEIKKTAGKGHMKKKVPSIIFNLCRSLQLNFMDIAIQGDGHYYNTSKNPPRMYNDNKYIGKLKKFCYTTKSIKLCAGFNFLCTRLNCKYSNIITKCKDGKPAYNVFSSAYRQNTGKKTFKKYKYTGYIYDITTENNYFSDALGLIGVHNTFMLHDAGFMGVDTSPAKTFFHYPSDGGGRLPAPDVLRKVDMPISASKFGRDQVKKVHGIDSEYIPHAFDPKIFYQISDEEKAENRIKWSLTGKFVVGVVARNQNRKMLDRTIKAFALFCHNKPEAVLLMHCDPHDGAQAFDINTLITRCGIQNRVIYTGTTFFTPFSYDRMREVYNLMDVFFLTTSGEGFGIPIIEAMACGVPQVVTDYTTSKELVYDGLKSGELVRLVDEEGMTPYPYTDDILSGTITGNYVTERAIMSVYAGVEKLNKLYSDKQIRNFYKRNSIKKAANYTWDKTMPLWRKTLKRLEDQ